jgi:hypothetical protein
VHHALEARKLAEQALSRLFAVPRRRRIAKQGRWRPCGSHRHGYGDDAKTPKVLHGLCYRSIGATPSGLPIRELNI